jgi:hypothetical protein
MQMERAIGVARDLPGGAHALGCGYGPAPCPERRPQGSAGAP